MKRVGKSLPCWAAVCGLVFSLLWLGGCQTKPAEQQFAPLPPGLAPAEALSPAPGAANPAPAVAPAPAPTAGPAPAAVATNAVGPEPEVFRVGDSLTVMFTDTPMAVQPFEEKVREDGTITLAQNETFKAAGKTRGALEKEIRARYVPDYYKQLTVTVKPVETTRWYYVDGEVKVPSRQIHNIRITVLKAIATAGGFTDFANKREVMLTRVDGRTEIVNCRKALDNPTLDPEVYPGDRIFVKRSLW